MLTLGMVITSLFLVARSQSNLEPPSTSGALSALKYTNVGGSGSYNQVTNMIAGQFPTCNANPSCIQSPVSVSGALAPFDEDLTFNFRGPMTLFNIAVYQPSDPNASTWTRVSGWAQNQPPTNMVFMNNLGGGNSGIFTICGGNSQSYAAGNWVDTVATPNEQLYPGNLPAGKEINILTATQCNGSGCVGFSRGASNLGWAGSKMVVIDYNMPPDSSSPPAIWSLNGQIVRAAEFGCNCRGVGSPGGCGELDIAEILQAGSNQAISEIYSFKGATGTGNNFFSRPTSGRATIAAIFDIKTDSIMIIRLTNWDYTQTSISRSAIDSYLNAPAMIAQFGTDNSVPGTGGTLSGPSSPSSGGLHQLHPDGNSAKCIDVQGGIIANGTPVQIFDCNGTPAQNWALNSGTTSVQLAGTSFCLDAGSSPANGIQMKIWQCFSGLATQTWTYTSDNRLTLQNTGLCLDLTNGSTANGNIIQTWSCTSGDTNQVWTE